MWRRWHVFAVVAAVGCSSDKRAPAAGSAVTPVAAVAADATVDAPGPKLDVTCTAAMLPPRIPPPPPTVEEELLKGIGGNGLLGPGTQGLGDDGLGRGIGLGVGGGMIGTGDGYGGGMIGTGAAHVPQVQYGPLVVAGSLQKEIIARYLRRDRPRFQYCYELELQKTPGLAGKVTLAFVVLADGKVSGVNTSGVAAACVHDALAVLELPKPPDGAIVKVQTSLTFQPNDQSSSTRWNRYGPRFQPTPTPAAPKPAPVVDTRSWTPFAASNALASADVAGAAADELAKVAPMAKLATCFAGKTGSIRSVVKIAFDGKVIGARSGGLGDSQVDACISTSLIGLQVTAPPTVSEVTCDIVRGDRQPWRIASDGYTVLEVTPTEIRESGTAIPKAKLVPQTGDGSRAFLLVVDPAAPPAQLVGAFARTSNSAATLVAVKGPDGVPVFVAMGRDGRSFERDGAPLFAIQPTKDSIKSCLADDARGTAPRGEFETLLATLASSCLRKPCGGTLSIGLASTMQELVTYADAARRAGFERIGFSTMTCP